MCGICGEVRRKGGGNPDAAVVADMNAALRHRGPDDEGIWTADGVALGARRLSIIELSALGHQPMTDAEAGLALTYNGEIYNYRELRDELVREGQVFHTGSDTEVLLRAYRAWGPAMLARLNGMFAFALWDARAHRLFAARDRIGQKPFFYHHGPRGLAFSSELTSLMRHPDLPRRIDRESVAAYLSFDGVPAPRTILQGVRKLPPAHALAYDPVAHELKTWRYWDPLPLAQARNTGDPGEEDFKELETTLRAAVDRHMRSDVPVGIYLSSGIDSGVVVRLAADQVGARNLDTFTVATDQPTFDESPEARELAQALGTRHHEQRVTAADALLTIPAILAGIDEPLADQGLIAVSQVSQFAAKRVKVVLSGDGGDELFFGYEPFIRWRLSQQLARLPHAIRSGLLPSAANALPADFGYMGLSTKAGIFLRGIARPMHARNSAWVGAFLPGEIRALLVDGNSLEGLAPGTDGAERLFDPLAQLWRRNKDLDELMRVGLEFQAAYLVDCICAHTDKASMAVSLEARSPFLDNEVIDYANKLPADWKLRGRQGKWILRRWLERRADGHATARRRKRGYTLPLAQWMRRDLAVFVEDRLSARSLEKVGIFLPAPVQALWQEHRAGKRNHYKKIWALVVMQDWCLRNLQA
jgi:asparagine synthase (glutamine-hydrolysing)